MSIFKKRLKKERLDTFLLFYKSPKFALIDLCFSFVSLFINPYRSCRRYLKKRGEKNIYAYGETPYTTYQKIAEVCGIGPQDTWIELGAGRGKGCFWLSHFIGCRVIGVEWNPVFTQVARALQFLFRMHKLRFIREDFQSCSLDEASVIYVYGIFPKLNVKKGVKVISTSEPLEGFVVKKRFWVRFPWGRTAAFLQEKNEVL